MKIGTGGSGITIARRWHWQALHLFNNHYRPERHYMRGPGPKWREKHGLAE